MVARVCLVFLAVAFTAGCGTSSTRKGDVSLALNTHCGISEAQIGSVYYEADTPLSDGNGNPPPGWPEPIDRGTAHVNANGTMIFTDSHGHVVGFHVRRGATGPKTACS